MAAIEAALDAFRPGGPGRPPWGPRGPWGTSHGDHGNRGDHGNHGEHYGFGPHGRPHGGRPAVHDHGIPHGGPHGAGGHPGFGLGPMGGRAAFRVLAVLAASGPKSVSELADAVGVDQPRASRLVQSAIAAGHVRREADPNDARRSILLITEAGRSLLSAAHGHRRESIEAALSGFSDAERAEFARLLTRFVADWPRSR